MGETCDGRHMCEPSYWPANTDETWTCDDCGRLHRAARVEDMTLPAGTLARVPAGTIGWKSDAGVSR